MIVGWLWLDCVYLLRCGNVFSPVFTVAVPEYLFKLALANKQYVKVMQYIKSSRLCGQVCTPHPCCRCGSCHVVRRCAVTLLRSCVSPLPVPSLQAVIAYLQRAGYPEVALHFVDDEPTRFNLALECGNLDVALQVG